MIKKILITIFVLALLGAVASYNWANYARDILAQKAKIDSTIVITIPEYTGLNKAISILTDEGLIGPDWFFEYYAKYIYYTRNASVHAGTYRFAPGLSQSELLSCVLNGTSLNTLMVTFPEGLLIEEFASIAKRKLGCDSLEFVRLSRSAKFLESYGISAKNAEGYLMPDTYEFFYNAKTTDVLARLLGRQNKMWDEKYSKMKPAIDLTRHQILTLASIIEAETPDEKEMPIVGGVYVNRLKKGMLLEADPTVQYAIGNKKRLLRRHLEINNPYNTYKFAGLPPGPINSPGYKAIEAAINPAQHGFYFFVAIGDGSGRHNFSTSYRQHLAYVAEYKRNRRNHIN